MLWNRNTTVITFRIDKADWEKFVAACVEDKYLNTKPSQKVRELVLRWTQERELAAAAAAASSPPATAKKKPAKKKPAKSEKKPSRG